MKKITVPLVLLVLIAAFVAPIPAMGHVWLDRAEASYDAQDFSAASEFYAQAARLLPWRDGLWESAGVAATRAGKHLQALDYFERVSSFTEPGRVWLGITHLTLGDLDAADVALRQGLQTYDSPNLYNLLSMVYFHKNDIVAERDVMQNLIRLNPEDARAHYRLGLLLTVLEPEQALTHLMFAASLDSQFDPAVQTLRSALNLSTTQPDASKQMVTNGRALGLVKEWALAIPAFEKAISLDEDNAEAWAWLGEAKQQQNIIVNAPMNDAGKVELDKAVRLDHTSVVVRGLRALYWSRQGKHSQMLAEYLLAADTEPDNPAWQAGLGEAYVKRGDLISALTSYQRATELAPNESTYWALLAAFCAGNNIYLDEVGLPAAQKAVELSPDDPSTLDALGWVYLASRRYASAEQTLLDAIERFPDYLPAHLHLALTYLAQGNYPLAKEKLVSIQNTDSDGPYGEMSGKLLQQYFP